MGTGLRILVVDDDPDVLHATSIFLERAGYTVESTTDVFGLPIRVGRFHPNAILLDMELPAMTGDRLAVGLRKLRIMNGCKLIFYSGKSERALAEAVRVTGADGYLVKGTPRGDLLQRLRELLEGEVPPSAPVSSVQK